MAPASGKLFKYVAIVLVIVLVAWFTLARVRYMINEAPEPFSEPSAVQLWLPGNPQASA